MCHVPCAMCYRGLSGRRGAGHLLLEDQASLVAFERRVSEPLLPAGLGETTPDIGSTCVSASPWLLGHLLQGPHVLALWGTSVHLPPLWGTVRLPRDGTPQSPCAGKCAEGGPSKGGRGRVDPRGRGTSLSWSRRGRGGGRMSALGLGRLQVAEWRM